jgi:hypothetical protein
MKRLSMSQKRNKMFYPKMQNHEHFGFATRRGCQIFHDTIIPKRGKIYYVNDH